LCTAIVVTLFAVVGTCLDFAAEERRVAEWNAALEKMSTGCETLWSDPRCRSAIVLLQDRAQHIGESVDSRRRALTTMHSVMLPRNPLPATFPLLLDTFRSSHRIHRLIELNLVAVPILLLGGYASGTRGWIIALCPWVWLQVELVLEYTWRTRCSLLGDS
jgi:hypothetical protein